MLEAPPGAKGPHFDTADDVRRQLVAREVVDEAAGTRVVRADDSTKEGLYLVETALKREDVSGEG